MGSCKCFIPFIIFALIIILIVHGILIAALIYFVRIKDGGNLSSSESTSMIWVSAIGIAATLTAVLWSIYLIYKCSKKNYSCKYGFDVPDLSKKQDSSEKQLDRREQERRYQQDLDRRREDKYRSRSRTPQQLNMLQRQGRA